MAEFGVQLNSFYVYPTCSPTRASLLTGRPPSRFGILNPIGGRSTQALPHDIVTLPELLRRNGYATAIIAMNTKTEIEVGTEMVNSSMKRAMLLI